MSWRSSSLNTGRSVGPLPFLTVGELLERWLLTSHDWVPSTWTSARSNVKALHADPIAGRRVSTLRPEVARQAMAGWKEAGRQRVGGVGPVPGAAVVNRLGAVGVDHRSRPDPGLAGRTQWAEEKGTTGADALLMATIWSCFAHGDNLVMFCSWRQSGHVLLMATIWSCFAHGDNLVMFCSWRQSGHVLLMATIWSCFAHGDNLVRFELLDIV